MSKIKSIFNFNKFKNNVRGDVSILREEETSSLNNYWAMLGRKVGHVDTRLKAVGAREITWEG